MKKKARKILLWFLIVLMGCTASLFGINAYVKNDARDRILTVEEAGKLTDVDCILVLGAGVNGDQPSAMLRDRLACGVELFYAGASDRLLMSGDHGKKNYDEVAVMKTYAIDAGIKSSEVFMDHAGFSTYESMYRARDIFKAKKIIVVTQGYHLSRALYIADKLGLEAYGVASDPCTYAGQKLREAREILARVKDFFQCIFKPEPTYLGEAIPVAGNGDLTND